MFSDREDAASQLASQLRDRPLQNPVVLAIPRGGVVTGAVLARELGAELDVVFSRKLRAPQQPEYALGAVAETGEVFLNPDARQTEICSEEYLEAERQRQLGEIARRKKLIRAVLPAAEVRGRSVIVTDDGIATGATMIAALQIVRSQGAAEIIVAVPVASPDRLAAVAEWCDEVICLLAPRSFQAIGQFYLDFPQVEDDKVLELLRPFARRRHTSNSR